MLIYNRHMYDGRTLTDLTVLYNRHAPFSEHKNYTCIRHKNECSSLNASNCVNTRKCILYLQEKALSVIK